ncbi:MAG: hypothetical protein NC221_02620 [Duncaniella sp.]|nr:hypothetical protein [Muribaculum sp.]MCM1254994.1 hypothetical protein [Duncaniella sp.]
MNEDLQKFLDLLRDPSAPADAELIRRLVDTYPFFTLPAVTLLRRKGKDLDPGLRAAMMERIALNATDAESLLLLTDRDRDSWLHFYPDETPKEVTTDDAISTFLETYGHSTPEEDQLLERLIFNPTPDYSTILSREEEESLPPAVEPGDDSQDALINAFILKSKSGTEHLMPQLPEPEGDEALPVVEVKRQEVPTAMSPEDHPKEAVPHGDDSSLRESLAKIYIKQHRYDKAFEIIHSLSLNNPKKSIYFADQLRFLRKLILNSKYSK